MSFLPAVLIFQDRHLRRCAPTPRRHPFAFLNYLLKDVLPYVVVSGRFVWLTCLTAIFGVSCYITATGLHFPQYNPLQLFVSSNEHEWYDNNAERQFEFVKNKIGLYIGVRLMWGLSEVHTTSVFRVDTLTNVAADPAFHLQTIEDVQRLADKLRQFRQLQFVQHGEKFWPERFLEWSKTLQCRNATAKQSGKAKDKASNRNDSTGNLVVNGLGIEQLHGGTRNENISGVTGENGVGRVAGKLVHRRKRVADDMEGDRTGVCCNYLHESYRDTELDYCMRLSTVHLYTQYNDTLVFDNKTFDLVGYTAALPTNIVFSYKFSNLSKIFKQLEDAFGGEPG
ncbi:unnamed protein product [Anisakis simplex]|uniref:Protein dispatched (inferred by orthology to a D. melanogaster protein) n=1 Tax=Anisakis simplex TaxID=6269 RepID=A0A0M3J992_ANISI|nr:unnamed protein product [Anisakis simplex]